MKSWLREEEECGYGLTQDAHVVNVCILNGCIIQRGQYIAAILAPFYSCYHFMTNTIYLHLLCRLQWAQSLFHRDKACGCGDNTHPSTHH